VVKEEFSLL